MNLELLPAFLVPVLVVALPITIIILMARKQNKANQQGQRNPLRPNESLRPERLQLVYRTGGWGNGAWGGGPRREIYQDTQTGVQYLVVGTGYSAAVTPVLDRDGKPFTSQF